MRYQPLNIIKKLRLYWSAEADAILARFYLKSQQPELALGAFQSAFKKLQTDPWPYWVIMKRNLKLALKLAEEM